MNYPTTLDNFPLTVQDGTNVVNEAHTIPVTPGPYTVRLGASAPSGWQLVIPDGAFPLSAPGAPVLTAQTSGGSLTVSSIYKYVVVFGTQYGETMAGTEASITLSGTQTAVVVSGIPLGGTTTNPCLYRKIFRTAAGGASGTEKQVGFLDDNTTTVFVDTLADVDLPNLVPAGSNLSGQQLVTIAGYTEVASAPALNQFVVDYGITSTGGLLTFNSGNQGAAIQVSYTGGTLVNKPLFDSIITAVNALETQNLQRTALISAASVTLTNCNGFFWGSVPGTDKRGIFQISATSIAQITVQIPFTAAYSVAPICQATCSSNVSGPAINLTGVASASAITIECTGHQATSVLWFAYEIIT